jgi:hypothetical protein
MNEQDELLYQMYDMFNDAINQSEKEIENLKIYINEKDYSIPTWKAIKSKFTETFEETIECIKESMEETEDVELKNKFSVLLTRLNSLNKVSLVLLDNHIEKLTTKTQ